MRYAVVLAAGIGSRLGGNIPKQFVLLGGKPVYLHCMEKIVACGKFDGIIVTVKPEYMREVYSDVKKFFGLEEPISICEGGETRNESILNAIAHIREEYGRSKLENDVVLTHDAARPFLTMNMIEESLSSIENYDAVTCAVEITDTLVLSREGLSADEIPLRGGTYREQTPQTFRMRDFEDIYSSLTSEERESLTDVCRAFLLKGKKVGIVEGSAMNVKITKKEDMLLAEQLIRFV